MHNTFVKLMSSLLCVALAFSCLSVSAISGGEKSASVKETINETTDTKKEKKAADNGTSKEITFPLSNEESTEFVIASSTAERTESLTFDKKDTTVSSDIKISGSFKTLYDALAEKIKEAVPVLDGNPTLEDVRVYEFDFYGMMNEEELKSFTFSPDVLGLSDSDLRIVGGDVTQALNNAVNDKIYDMIYEIIDSSLLVRSLLATLPFELYWFDKTVSTNASVSIRWSASGRTVSGVTTVTGINLTAADFTIYMSTANDYRGGYSYQYSEEDVFYSLDEAKYNEAYAAKANADAIIEKYASLNDTEKLKAYHDEICDLVSYNTAAASGSKIYGDPWQMVYVFDGNADTNVVCEGYSKAFKYLCDNSTFAGDVSCHLVEGSLSQSGSADGPHMWNCVTIDGQNYLVDVTNDDSSNTYDLFLKKPKAGDNTRGYIIEYGPSYLVYKLDNVVLDVLYEDCITLTPDYAFGDVNMDGVIDVCDCVKTLNNGLSFLQKFIADVDGNSVVDSEDANIIAEYCVGIRADV